MPSLKIEVLCMLGCKEAQARVVAVKPWMGMNCVLEGVCVCVSVVMRVCVCQIFRENKPKERNGYSRTDCVCLEVGRGRVRVSKCVR